jgi:hypothetical protein
MLLNNAKILYGPFDISGDLNSVEITADAGAVDRSTFGVTTRVHRAGQFGGSISLGGLMFEDTTEVAKAIFDRLGTANVLMSVIPQGNAAGNVAYFLKSVSSQFGPGGQVGNQYAFNASALASGHLPMVRGRLEHAKAARAASGVTAGYQLGAVASGQRVYVGAHVFTVTGVGATMTVELESDDNGAFSSPTSRITMTPATAATSELLSLDGPVTDTWWRLKYTIAGAGPSIEWAGVIGIR